MICLPLNEERKVFVTEMSRGRVVGLSLPVCDWIPREGPVGMVGRTLVCVPVTVVLLEVSGEPWVVA